jgi:hypothetical protein
MAAGLAAGLALALPAAPAAAEPDPVCVYPYDGGWCTPRVSDLTPTVGEYCVYPYDGGWCIPWVEA